MTQIITPTDEAIEKAADVLRAGGLVGLPTETVYGLAANAYDDKAVAKIYAAKGRPNFNPLIVHYASPPTINIPPHPNPPPVGGGDYYAALAQAFWPGPLTMIVPKFEARVSALATAGLDTVAVRVPAHKTARQLLAALDFPLVAPSANLSGSLSPTTPTHVAEGLGTAVDLILAGGASDVGLESTVVDLTGDVPIILRPGGITAEEISDALGLSVGYDVDGADAIKSPGQLLKHYAPETPLRLNAVDVEEGEALLGFGSLKFMGLKEGGRASDLPEGQVLNLSEEGDLYAAAAHLFAMLKELDKGGFARIAVMNIPQEGLGVAINDRLKRAAC